jgi:hypothetical protein
MRREVQILIGLKFLQVFFNERAELSLSVILKQPIHYVESLEFISQPSLLLENLDMLKNRIQS